MKFKKYNLSFQNLTLAEGSSSSEIQLFKYGQFEHWSGTKFDVNQEFCDMMIKNFRRTQALSKDADHTCPIDYNHASLSYGAEDAKAAGWVTDVYQKEDGLYAKVNWTEKAAEYIRNGEYKYISPEFGLDSQDEYGEEAEGPSLFAAALTNRPFLKGMEPLSLSQKRKEKIMKEKLVKLFALPETGGDEEVLACAERQVALVTEISSTLECKVEEVVSKLKTLKELNLTLSQEKDLAIKEVESLKAETLAKEIESILLSAVTEGKLSPADKEKARLFCSSVEKAHEFVSILKVQFSTGSSGKEGENKEASPASLHDEALKCAAAKGISYELALREVAKANPEMTKQHVENVPSYN